MTTSAIEKIITAIGTALAPLDGGSDPIKIFSDRQGEPIEEGERPAINIRFVEDIHDVQLGMGECWHTAQIMLDVYDDSSATDTMTPLLSRIGASAWGLIAADLSLGGLASNTVTIGFSASSENAPDVGCAVMELHVNFSTPADNFFTILGASGPVL